MKVTAFNKKLVATTEVPVHSAREAAQVAVKLADVYPYLKVEDGDYKLVFPASAKPSEQRIAHIVKHHANVNL